MSLLYLILHCKRVRIGVYLSHGLKKKTPFLVGITASTLTTEKSFGPDERS